MKFTTKNIVYFIITYKLYANILYVSKIYNKLMSVYTHTYTHFINFGEAGH